MSWWYYCVSSELDEAFCVLLYCIKWILVIAAHFVSVESTSELHLISAVRPSFLQVKLGNLYCEYHLYLFNIVVASYTA